MSLITLQNVGFDYGRQVILEGVRLTLHAGERYGLVGINGAGKSTFMRLLAGELDAARGSVQRASRVSVGYLTQDTELRHEAPLREAVRHTAFGELQALEQRLHDLSARMGEGDEDASLLEEYGTLHERFEAADGYTMESRCDAALLGLGFEMDRLDQPVNTLSGGQKRRAALAAILLAPHDVLLLDEPTNHLDLESREWLEAHLTERSGCIVAISHDRTFLDNATDFTLHLVKGRMDRFPGSYTRFHKLWSEQKAQWEERYRAQRDQIEKTEAFIRKNIAGQRTNQAKSRRKQLARLDRIEAPPSEGQSYRFDLEPRRASGQVVFECQRLSHRFEALELFAGVDLQVLKGEKIGILGPNGTGKTTLLKLLLRRYPPSEGRVVVGHNVDLGYYDQDLQLVTDNNTVLEEIRSLDPVSSDGALRSLLGAFAFGEDMVEQPVRTLSGGERARLSLLKLIMEKHNTLLLDEPTNHLDTDAREALEEALATFTGSLIVVSHDRYFLNRICDRTLAFELPEGRSPARVRQILGNYDDYRRLLARERDAAAAARPAAKPPAAPATRHETKAAASAPVSEPKRKRDLSKNELSKLRQEVADLEEEIILLESDLEDVGQEMSGGQLEGDAMAEAAKRAQDLQAILNKKTERWEEISTLLERNV